MLKAIKSKHPYRALRSIEYRLARGVRALERKTGLWATALVIAILGMDELTEEDRLVVARARKIERFLSQPNFVAEQFTGIAGKYVPVKETIRSFRELVEGKHDDLPESAFLMVGNIDEAVEKARRLSGS